MDGWTDGWMAAGGGGERERFSGVNVVYEFFSFFLCNGTCSCADHQLKKGDIYLRVYLFSWPFATPFRDSRDFPQE